MISIIIPAYNSSATIVEALESVLAQSIWAEKTTDHRPQTADQGEENTPHPNPLPQGARVQSMRDLQSPDRLPLPLGELSLIHISEPTRPY